MTKPKYIAVGVIVKPHGLKGDAVVKSEANYALQFREFKVLYLNHAGAYVPYLVEAMASLNKGLFKVKLNGVNDQSEVNPIRGVQVFQEAAKLQIDKQLDLTGYIVMDRVCGRVGVVQTVIDSTAQTVLEVLRDGEEVYIPFVADLIISVSESDQTIEMDLPDGMLDL
ncbi:MAG: ribosome maturation factor RimM [Salibacteraceae bacterium]